MSLPHHEPLSITLLMVSFLWQLFFITLWTFFFFLLQVLLEKQTNNNKKPNQKNPKTPIFSCFCAKAVKTRTFPCQGRQAKGKTLLCNQIFLLHYYLTIAPVKTTFILVMKISEHVIIFQAPVLNFAYHMGQ